MKAVITGATCSRPQAWPGCRRCPTTCRPCWPPTRSGSRARRSPSSSPRTATRPATRSSSSTSSTRRSTRSSTPRKALDAGRAGHPRRHRGQDRQPHLRLGVGRQGALRRGVRQGRRRRQPGHALPARAPGSDGDVRQRRQPGQGHRQADRLVHEPGAARPPHALRARGRAARAQDPDHLPRHRRRLRRQGRHLPGLRAGRRRLHRHRASR